MKNSFKNFKNKVKEIKKESVKKVLVFFVFILFFSCSYQEYESVRYEAPNWTSDNKIVFIEVYWWQKYRKSIFGNEDLVDNREIGYLWEVNADGTEYKRIAKLWDSEYNLAVTNTSSAGEWVAFSILGKNGYEIWLIKRDGTNLHKLTDGKYPDFSPDARKIVFVRHDGLYTINRDGSNLKKITPDPNATHPAWSSDGGRIAWLLHTTGDFGYLCISDTTGILIDSFHIEIAYPDWGPPDSNAISGNGINLKGLIIYLSTGHFVTLTQIGSGGGLKWSPFGSQFIGYDGKWYIINRSDRNKWYIKP